MAAKTRKQGQGGALGALPTPAVYNDRMIADKPTFFAVRLLILGAVLVAPAARADEAVDADGRATPGLLALDGAGRLRFTPQGQTRPLPPDSIAFVRFPFVPTDPFRVAFVRRLLLPDGQRVAGRLLAADGDALALRTAWADRLEAPRSAVVALRQPPGRLSVFEDDFSDGLKAWAVAGKPAVDGDPPVVRLSQPGQRLAYTPAELPEAGRVGVNFRDRDATGARWLAELRFQGDGEVHTLRVTLAGSGAAYEVEPPDVGGDAHRVVRSPGWHRLEVRFGDSLAVLCDDVVLWSDLHQGPGGTLRQVSLACVEAAKAGEARGQVEFAEFALTRSVDEPPRPPGDAGQDEVWLADGDQLFGDGLGIGLRAVELQGRFGKRSLPWSDVRGCWFKHAAPPPAEGSHVRLWIDSGLDPEPDILDGVLKSLDDKQLTLQHSSLGDLHVPRGRLRRLRPLVP